MIFKQLSINAVLRSLYRRCTEQGADKPTHHDRNQGRNKSVQIRLRPVEDQGNSLGETPKHGGSQGRPESTAPTKGVPCAHLPVHGPVQQCCAVEAPPR
ncbi:MAG: hypothetical protein AUJ96_18145 [Armatimonadetes bacterium CG2_30_66_41]|nr:MAG: hypothetical protein AUJ96_18145 [Armatimonadetes bacterium CG2_30_66_41]